MLNRPCRVLIIEDQPEDIERTKTMLSGARSASFPKGFELEYAQTLTGGKNLLDRQKFDVVLLDLILPDSRGMKTLQAIEDYAERVPFIIETAIEDEVIAVKALEYGACGYLPKILIDDNLIVYAIRAAIERKQFVKKNISQQQNEIDVLEQISTEIPVRDRPFTKVESLQERMPDVVDEIKQRYSKILLRQVENKLYDVNYQISNELNLLVEQLGYLQATPKDAIDIHTAAIKQKQINLGRIEAQIFVTEGRYLLLEVMGKLAAYYQRYYIGLSKMNTTHSYNKVSSPKE
ncbi:response regulator [Myxosarcina sp. GI1]|uniref:response regulator n=1 Tax=Myxosarcina sp. GI1 TaxID=1541065 RepID=UPI00055F45A8|nr:response regulator [Myxosarcina sp. GI1]